MQESTMATQSTLRFGAQTDEMTSLLRIVNMVRTGEAATRPEIGRVTGLGRGVVTQRVDHAIEMGYLADGEFGPSSGGRAPARCGSAVRRAASSCAPSAPCTSTWASRSSTAM